MRPWKSVLVMMLVVVVVFPSMAAAAAAPAPVQCDPSKSGAKVNVLDPSVVSQLAKAALASPLARDMANKKLEYKADFGNVVEVSGVRVGLDSGERTSVVMRYLTSDPNVVLDVAYVWADTSTAPSWAIGALRNETSGKPVSVFNSMTTVTSAGENLISVNGTVTVQSTCPTCYFICGLICNLGCGSGCLAICVAINPNPVWVYCCTGTCSFVCGEYYCSRACDQICQCGQTCSTGCKCICGCNPDGTCAFCE